MKLILVELEKFEDILEGVEVECRLYLLVYSKIIGNKYRGYMIYGKYVFFVRRDKLKRNVCYV